MSEREHIPPLVSMYSLAFIRRVKLDGIEASEYRLKF